MSASRWPRSFTRQRRSRRRIAGGVAGRQLRPVRLALQDLGERVRHGGAHERAAAGEHLVQHAAEGPDVRSLVDGAALRLLRRHVGGGSQDHARERAPVHQRRRARELGAGIRGRVLGVRLGEAEVEHLDLPVRRELDVGRLQVPVHDALLVGLRERVRDLRGDPERLVDRDAPAREPLGQVLALHQLEREERHTVRLLEPVDGGDVRVVERGEQPRLAPEAREPRGVLPHLGRQDLERHVAPELRVGGAVDLAHPARADRGGDAVVGEASADQGRGHGASTRPWMRRRLTPPSG